MTEKEKVWMLEVFSDRTYKISNLKTGETIEDKLNPFAMLLNLINLVFFSLNKILEGDPV